MIIYVSVRIAVQRVDGLVVNIITEDPIAFVITVTPLRFISLKVTTIAWYQRGG